VKPCAAEHLPSVEPIAIVGIGCRLPGAASPAALWKLLCAGEDRIGRVPADRWDADAFYDPDPLVPGKMNSKSGGFLDQVDQFDPEFFGIAPREADLMDPQQRLLLEVAWEALEDAAIVPAALAQTAAGVFMGISSTNYAGLLHRDPSQVGPFTNSGASACIAANRISYTLDLRGPSLAVDAACSSSLLAVHLACQSLRARESTIALAGGANIILTPGPGISLAKSRMLSPDGRCRVFDKNANGFGRGEGAGIVVLKLLAQAMADGDPIYAVVRASATEQGGRGNGLTAPSRWAQEAVLRTAWQRAGIPPSSVQFIEAQSAGTPIGDATELNALGAVMAPGRPADAPCIIGSIKTNIGHLEAAAGIAGLIKTSLMLRQQTLVPSLHFESANPHVPFDKLGLRIQRQLEPLQSGALALAGVSSSGYGGVNVHIAMEAPPARPAGTNAQNQSPALFTLSARSAEALKQSAAAYAAHLDTRDEVLLASLCFTAGAGRTQFKHRLAMIVAAKADLRARLTDFANDQSRSDIVVGTARRVRASAESNHTVDAAADLALLAAQFVNGANLSWQPSAIAPPMRCSGLPTYPFQRQRYWVGPLASSIPQPQRQAQAQAQPAEACSETRPANSQRDIVPPRSEIEHALAQMWQSILGVNPVGITDNFFALGGASLMAVEFFAKVEKEISITLDPRTLFECPTIELLAPRIANQTLARSAPLPAPLLVPIRAYGTGSPILLVAPDHLFHYTPLSRLLQSGHPVYGFQPPFADGFRSPDMTIEQMAQTYLAQLESIGLSDQFHLVGLCAGGVIAYEMAQIMRASGRRIGLLAMLDTPCPPTDRLPLWGNWAGKWQYRLIRSAAHVRNLSRLGFTDAARYLLLRSRLLLRTALPTNKTACKPDLAASLASMANRAAIYRYRPQPYRGRIDLFMANEPYPSLREDTRHRWTELCTDTRMHRVPGTHSGMLREPQAIADLINTELSNSDAKPVSNPPPPIAGVFDNALMQLG
jgi:3-oxoacyl-(acyl-carrier-protein) synthase/thioesterase domain-containing protein/acyl carrier protein